MSLALVQQQQATIGAAALSAAFALGAAPTLGNMLVCAWEHNDGGSPTMSGTGVTWTRQNTFLGDGSHDNIALFTGVVGGSASATQTFTQSGSTANAAGICLEFSGVQQVLDGTPPTPTNLSTATPSKASNAPSVAGDLAVGFCGITATTAPTASPSGWNALTAASNTRRIEAAWLDLAASSSIVTPQWTWAASKFALMEVVLIKAAAAAGTKAPPFQPRTARNSLLRR